jgi:hypothetical protein
LFSIDFSFFFWVFTNVAYRNLRSTTSLLFDFILIFGMLFINLFEFTFQGYILPVTLTFDPKVQILTVNLPYAIICDLDLLLQGQVIFNLKRKYISWHASPGTFPQIKLSITIYWNIVESGIKHHKAKPINIHMNW